MRGLLAKVRAPIWCITRGDSNPTCLWTLSHPLVPGGLERPFGSLRRLLSGRWPPASAPPAFCCFAGHSLQRSRSPLREPFSNFAVHFRVRRRGEIYESRVESP